MPTFRIIQHAPGPTPPGAARSIDARANAIAQIQAGLATLTGMGDIDAVRQLIGLDLGQYVDLRDYGLFDDGASVPNEVYGLPAGVPSPTGIDLSGAGDASFGNDLASFGIGPTTLVGDAASDLASPYAPDGTRSPGHAWGASDLGNPAAPDGQVSPGNRWGADDLEDPGRLARDIASARRAAAEASQAAGAMGAGPEVQQMIWDNLQRYIEMRRASINIGRSRDPDRNVSPWTPPPAGTPKFPADPDSGPSGVDQLAGRLVPAWLRAVLAAAKPARRTFGPGGFQDPNGTFGLRRRTSADKPHPIATADEPTTVHAPPSGPAGVFAHGRPSVGPGRDPTRDALIALIAGVAIDD